MKATAILMAEHRVIEQVLASLERATERLEGGSSVSPSFFVEATKFIRGFADGCHHQKEEGVLFPAMTAAGMPSGAGPIAVMLSEHEQAREFARGLHEAAQRLVAGDEQAKAEVIRNAQGYVALLRQHIEKEDNVLFPMAEKVIPQSQHAEVTAHFERIESEATGEASHEEYLALAERLEREINS